MVNAMKLKEKLYLHWRHYGVTERAFVLLPLLILTPRLLNHLEGGHNGEPSQEFVITLSVFGMLILLGIEARRSSHLRLSWQGRNNWLLLATALFAGWSAASLLWTSDVGATQDHTVLWLNYAAVIFVGCVVLRKRSAMGLMATFATLGFALALFRLMQYWVTVGERPLSSPIYRNLGVEPELLVTILPLIIVLQLTVRRAALAKLLLAVAAIVWMGSLSTYQRAPLLAAILGFGLLAAGWLMKWLVPQSKWRLAALVVTLGLTGGWQMSLPAKVQEQQAKRSGKDWMMKQVKGIREMEVDTSSRLQFWSTAIEMLRVHPVVGVGAGAYKTNYVIYRGIANAHPSWGRVKDFSQLDGTDCVYRAHNEFIEALAELGIVGLALIGAVVLVLAGLLWCMPPSQRWIATGVGASALAFFVSSSLTSFSFRWIPCGLLFFFVSALILPWHRHNNAILPIATLRSPCWAVALAALLLFFGVARTGQVMLSEYYQYQAQAVVDKEQGIVLYQRALAINPHNFSAAAELGGLFYRSNQPQAAVPYLEAGVRHGLNNIFNYAKLAFAYSQLGQQARARAVLQEAVAAYPGTVFARSLYAEALAKEGNAQAASEQRAIAQAIKAEDAAVWDLILQQGLKAATLAAAQQQLPHPAKLEPKVGLGVIQERERLAQ